MQRYMSRWLFGSSATDDDELLDGEADSNSPSWYSPSGYVHRKYNSLVDAQLDKFMPFMSDYLLSYIVEKEAGDESTQRIVSGWADSWPDVEADLRWKLRLKLGVQESTEQTLLRSLRLRHWATAYPPLCKRGWPQPFAWYDRRNQRQPRGIKDHQSRMC